VVRYLYLIRLKTRLIVLAVIFFENQNLQLSQNLISKKNLELMRVNNLTSWKHLDKKTMREEICEL
jgi:hypothetical protein